MNLAPAFFTSIPKCGKNIIYSFFFSLGYKRYFFENIEYNRLSNLDSCGAYPDCDHYVDTRLQGPVGQSAREAARQSFLMECSHLPVRTVSHRHLHADSAVTGELVKLGLAPIFVYRDPRACLISAVHWARKGKPGHVAELLSGMDVEEAALAILTGCGRIVPFDVWFDAYRGYLEMSHVLSVRFEDIIGPRGGGCQKQQTDSFRRILDFMGVEVPLDAFDKAVSDAFNPRAGTFRNGQINAWRNEFSPRVAEEFERRMGRLLGAWGYAV